MQNPRRARTRARAAVLVEYALLLTFFAIPVVMGLAAGGVAMLKEYKRARDRILLPYP